MIGQDRSATFDSEIERCPATYLDKMIGQHVPHSPALIRVSSRELNIQLGLYFLRRKLFGDSDQVWDSEQSD